MSPALIIDSTCESLTFCLKNLKSADRKQSFFTEILLAYRLKSKKGQIVGITYMFNIMNYLL